MRENLPRRFRRLRDRSIAKWHRHCCSRHSRSNGRSPVLHTNPRTSGVPNLKFDLLVANLHASELEVHSDGRQQLLIELSIHELAQQGRFSLIATPIPTAESPTSTSLYSAVGTGIIKRIIMAFKNI